MPGLKYKSPNITAALAPHLRPRRLKPKASFENRAQCPPGMWVGAALVNAPAQVWFSGVLPVSAASGEGTDYALRDSWPPWWLSCKNLPAMQQQLLRFFVMYLIFLYSLYRT